MELTVKKIHWTERIPALLLAILLGFVLRLVLAKIFYGGTNDVSAYEQFSHYFREGKSPYDASGRYNYAPVWYWIISACSEIARYLNLPFSFVIKWPLILSDALLTAMIFLSAQKMGRDFGAALKTAAVFALNPVSIVMSGYGGQFDNTCLVFIFLSWFLLAFFGEKKYLTSSIFFAIGTAAKHFSVLLAPAFAFKQKGFKRGIFFLILPPIFFLGLLAPYFIKDHEHIVKHVFGYNLHAGYWGWSGVFCRLVLLLTRVDLVKMPWFHWMDYFNLLVYAALFWVSYRWSKKYDLLDLMVAVILFFYVFTTQMAPQYTVWIVPFAVLRRNVFFYWYQAFGALQLGFFYYCHYFWEKHLPMGDAFVYPSKIFVILRHLTWLVCVLWFWSMTRQRQHEASAR